LGELHLGFKATKILHEDVFNFRLDISLRRAVEDIKKMTTAITSMLNQSNIGGRSHNLCVNKIEALALIAQAALNDIKALPLAAFGRKQAEKPVVSWDSVLTRAENSESER
jgi:hypothetical protein